MPTTYTTLLVGAHFRPPAKQVLAHLPAGARLQFELDNDNLYDQDAVRVYIEPQAIPESQFPALTVELPEAGMTLDQLMSGGAIWLGFVPSSVGKPLAKARTTEPGLIGNSEVRGLMTDPEFSATLAFAVDGSPRAQITVAEG